MGDYAPIPSGTAVTRAITDLAAQQRRSSDTTSGQLHNTAQQTADTLQALQATVADVQAQAAFLLGQTAFAQGQKTWSDFVDRSGSGGWEWIEWDSTIDTSLQVAPSSTGNLRVDVAAAVIVNQGGNTPAGAAAGFEIIDDASGAQLVAPSVHYSACVEGIKIGMIWASCFGFWIGTVNPTGATVTVRSRRGQRRPVAPETSWAGVDSLLLSVTKLGM